MQDMLTEMLEKRIFVVGELASMLRCALRGGWLTSIDYGFDGANEFVTIEHMAADGRRETRVNVTCDSKWAIAKDVMRAVSELYD